MVAHATDTIEWFDFLFHRPKSRNSRNHHRLQPVLHALVTGKLVPELVCRTILLVLKGVKRVGEEGRGKV